MLLLVLFANLEAASLANDLLLQTVLLVSKVDAELYREPAHRALLQIHTAVDLMFRESELQIGKIASGAAHDCEFTALRVLSKVFSEKYILAVGIKAVSETKGADCLMGEQLTVRNDLLAALRLVVTVEAQRLKDATQLSEVANLDKVLADRTFSSVGIVGEPDVNANLAEVVKTVTARDGLPEQILANQAVQIAVVEGRFALGNAEVELRPLLRHKW